MPEIERAIDQVECKAKFLDDYMASLDGKTKKKGKVRDYKSAGGRERAGIDYLEENKTRMAKWLAEAISGLKDEARRFPKNIADLFQIVGKAHNLQKAKDGSET